MIYKRLFGYSPKQSFFVFNSFILYALVIMNYLIIVCLLFSSLNIYAQALPRAVKKINPSVFINNMENERVYQQANIKENLVVFSRGFENRSIEEIQQSFHYCFLDEKTQHWMLELKFDRHDIKIAKSGFMEPIGCNDFGIKIYEKREDVWHEVTLEAVPVDFIMKLSNKLPELQKGSRGLYFYNQVPEKAVHVEFDKNRLAFKQNGITVLSLVWKKEAFIWKK